MQQTQQIHRALRALIEAAPSFKWLFEALDEIWNEFNEIDGQPAYVYVPFDMLQAVTRENSHHFRKMDERDIAIFATIGRVFASWRYTKGIYRFDSELYKTLIETDMSGDIPVDVLTRLPEWCVYCETPGLTLPDGVSMHGVWAHIDIAGDGHDLVLMQDVDKNTKYFPIQTIPLQNTSIERALHDLAKISEPVPMEYIQETIQWVKPVVNLLLYLCSKDAEYTRNGVIGQPQMPQPVKTRRHGMRIFKANKPVIWEMGVRMGAALRAARARADHEATGEGHSPRPHIRRAHWHTIVSGAKKRPDGTEIPPQARRREVRWMPPIPVNVTPGTLDTLPAVIRPVSG